jgi:hypothetical protein
VAEHDFLRAQLSGLFGNLRGQPLAAALGDNARGEASLSPPSQTARPVRASP